MDWMGSVRRPELERAPHLVIQKYGGPEGIRTPDLLNAMQRVYRPPESARVVSSSGQPSPVLGKSTRVHKSPSGRMSNRLAMIGVANP